GSRCNPMFYELALLLCLAVFFIVLACGEILCAAGLWMIRRSLERATPRTSANLLFTLRTLPLFLALSVTLGFALPAFLRFEPHSSGELIRFRLSGLATLGALVIALAAARCWRVLRATHRAQKEWHSHAELLQQEGVELPVYCADGACPL